MEVIRRLSRRLSPTPLAGKHINLYKTPQFIHSKTPIIQSQHKPILNPNSSQPIINRSFSFSTSRSPASWLSGFGIRKTIMKLPRVLQAGHPVLHEAAQEVTVEEIGSDRVQKIIDDMIQVMRRRPGVGLAAPQIGIPLKIIVVEDLKEYIADSPEEENIAQDRRPVDLLVILNPKLRKKSDKSAIFFEGCLSVGGYRALVERYLEVEVNGLGRDGKPIKVEARGWQARILQHECDHLEGTLYVDKMVKRTFRTIENVDLPLPNGCPKQGVR